MQGFNMGRYVPPDQEGLVSGNQLHGARPQRTAAASGAPIVRFEMPFAVWCDGCQARSPGAAHPVLIGQGVRFNAEKHRSGRYHSTPIWSFRMRHPACGTWLEIRTDPATTSYLVVAGGRRRREHAEEEGGEGGNVPYADTMGSIDRVDAAAARAAAAAVAARTGLAIPIPPFDSENDDGTASRLSAFDRLERTIAHRAAADAAAAAAASGRHRIDALAAESARRWQDPYARNRALRTAFRAGRHAREQSAAADDQLRARLGGLAPDLALLPATAEDERYAALIDFGAAPVADKDNSEAAADEAVLAQPLFPPKDENRKDHHHHHHHHQRHLPTSARSHTYAAGTETAQRKRRVRDHLASTWRANTRLKTDPFLDALDAWQTGLPRKPAAAGATIAGLRRKPEAPSVVPSTTEPEQKQQREAERKRAPESATAPTVTPDKKEKQNTTAALLVSYDSD